MTSAEPSWETPPRSPKAPRSDRRSGMDADPPRRGSSSPLPGAGEPRLLEEEIEPSTAEGRLPAGRPVDRLPGEDDPPGLRSPRYQPSGEVGVPGVGPGGSTRRRAGSFSSRGSRPAPEKPSPRWNGPPPGERRTRPLRPRGSYPRAPPSGRSRASSRGKGRWRRTPDTAQGPEGSRRPGFESRDGSPSPPESARAARSPLPLPARAEPVAWPAGVALDVDPDPGRKEPVGDFSQDEVLPYVAGVPGVAAVVVGHALPSASSGDKAAPTIGRKDGMGAKEKNGAVSREERGWAKAI